MPAKECEGRLDAQRSVLEALSAARRRSALERLFEASAYATLTDVGVRFLFPGAGHP